MYLVDIKLYCYWYCYYNNVIIIIYNNIIAIIVDTSEPFFFLLKLYTTNRNYHGASWYRSDLSSSLKTWCIC